MQTEFFIPVCAPRLLTGPKPLNEPEDICQHTLLHDSARKYWKNWFKAANIKPTNVNQGPIFSHSTMVLQAAIHGQGIALAHSMLARPELDAGRLISPFNLPLVSKNAYYLVCRESQADLGKITAFRDWVLSLVEMEKEDFLDEQLPT